MAQVVILQILVTNLILDQDVNNPDWNSLYFFPALPGKFLDSV